MQRFIPIVKLVIDHEYYGDLIGDCLTIEPDRQTKDVLDGTSCLVRSDNGTLTVLQAFHKQKYGTGWRSRYELPPNKVLRFKLFAKDPYFQNNTELPLAFCSSTGFTLGSRPPFAAPGKSAMYLSSSAKQEPNLTTNNRVLLSCPNHEKSRHLALLPKLFELNPPPLTKRVRILAANNELVYELLLPKNWSEQKVGYKIDLRGYADGVFDLQFDEKQEQVFVAYYARGRYPVAIVDINTSHLTPVAEKQDQGSCFVVPFCARKTHWRYNIVASRFAGQKSVKMSIVSDGLNFFPDILELEPDKSELVFVSIDPVPFCRKPIRNISLHVDEGTGPVVVVESLPNPHGRTLCQNEADQTLISECNVFV